MRRNQLRLGVASGLVLASGLAYCRTLCASLAFNAKEVPPKLNGRFSTWLSFNAEVRPWLSEIPIGRHGIAFDRLDLDRFAEEHKRRNGRVPEKGVSL